MRFPFQTPIGNSSRAHAKSAFPRDSDKRVSNPYREFISRAPIFRQLDAWTNVGFQTPIGNSSRAHFWANQRSRNTSHVSNPYREFISRALDGTSYGRKAVVCFKPLSGIHLARTCRCSARAGRTRRFQTPIGNSSRAHSGKRDMSRKDTEKFQTPIGNSSRAHQYRVRRSGYD